MNENLFEYSDMLRSPIEAFCCGTGYWEGSVSSHWHYFLELVYVQEGSVTVSCNDNTCLLKKEPLLYFLRRQYTPSIIPMISPMFTSAVNSISTA